MLPEQQQRILGYFIEEAKDHLNTIEQGLLNLQATIRNPEMANEVFRAAHSVKGGAAMLGIESMQRTAHRMEDYFKLLKEAPIYVDRSLESMFLRVFDALQELLEQLQGPFGLTEDKEQSIMAGVEPVFQQLQEHLDQLVAKADTNVVLEEEATPVAFTVPSPQPVEESALKLVFSSDVSAALREMLARFKQADTDESRSALEDCCRSLERFGEQFNLPNWMNLVKHAHWAVCDRNNDYRTLAPVLIKEIKKAQDTVLAGRELDIIVSETLQTLSAQGKADDSSDDLDALFADRELDVTLPVNVDDLSILETNNAFSIAESDVGLDVDVEVNNTQESSLASDSISLDALLNEAAASPSGPEVGMAELTSLADLFETGGEALDSDWQEEDIPIDEEIVPPEALDIDISPDFKDLLNNNSSSELELNQDDFESGDELADLFGDDDGTTVGINTLNEFDNNLEVAEVDQSNPFDNIESTLSESLDSIDDLFNDTATAPDEISNNSETVSVDDLFDDLGAQAASDTENENLDLLELSDNPDDLLTSQATGIREFEDLDLAFEDPVNDAVTSPDSHESVSVDDLFSDLEDQAVTDAEDEDLLNLSENLGELPAPEITSISEFEDLDLAFEDPVNDAVTSPDSHESISVDDLFSDLEDQAVTDAEDEDLFNLSEDLGERPAPEITSISEFEDLDLAFENPVNDAVTPPDSHESVSVDDLFSDLEDQAVTDAENEDLLNLSEDLGERPAPEITSISEFEDIDLAFEDPVNDTATPDNHESVSVDDLFDDLGDQTASDTDNEDLLNLADNLNELSAPETIPINQLENLDLISEDASVEENADNLLDNLGTEDMTSPQLDVQLERHSLFSAVTAEPNNPDATSESSEFDDFFTLDQSTSRDSEAINSDNLGNDLWGMDSQTNNSSPNIEATSVSESISDDDLSKDLWITQTSDSDLDLTASGDDLNISAQSELSLDKDIITPADNLTVEDIGDLDLDDVWASVEDIFIEEENTSATDLSTLETSSPDLGLDDLFSHNTESSDLSSEQIVELDQSVELDPDELTIASDTDLENLFDDDIESDKAADSLFSDVKVSVETNIDADVVDNVADLENLELTDPESIVVDTSDIVADSLFSDVNSPVDTEIDADIDNLTDLGNLELTDPEKTLDDGDIDHLVGNLELTEANTSISDIVDLDPVPENTLNEIVSQAEVDILSQPPSSDLDFDLLDLEDGGIVTGFVTDNANPDGVIDNLGIDLLTDRVGTPLTSVESNLNTAEALEILDVDESSDEAIANEQLPDVDSIVDLSQGPENFIEQQSVESIDTLLSEEFSIDSGDVTDSSAVTAFEGDDAFSDLEALLDSSNESVSSTLKSPSETSFDEVATPTLQLPLETNVSDNVDDEFGDLEALLQDADKTLATTSTRPTLPKRRLPDQTMRVSVGHLDNLSNLVGELVVNRNTLEQDQERLRQFLDNLLFQVQQLNDVGQRMRDLYERSLLESSLISSRQSYQMATTSTSINTTEQGDHATGASFDALEMDRFTGFHTLSQEMIELIVRVRESASDIAYTVESSDQVTRQFRQVTNQLQEGLNKARMVPFAQTAARLPRAVRDISFKCGKEARLVVEGRDILIDKMILEQLYDPMTHLVNNAITHGIELPEERRKSGKSSEGIITIRAFYQGNQTVISVGDDGAGIDPDMVKQKALQKGLISQSDAQVMTVLDVYDLLFHPGFSTRDQADDFAGRGVGMDVVRTSLADIRGNITIDSERGRGTNFTIRLPLTLSISKALSCISNQARIAFPMDGVEDMFDVARERIQQNDQGQDCILWRDTLLPFQNLSDLLSFNRTLGRGRVYGGNQDENMISIVVLRSAKSFIALEVDQVMGEQEIVIKQLEGPVPKPTGIAGATVLGDGRVMPIADVLELIDLAMGRVRREPNTAVWTQVDEILPTDMAKVKSEPTVLIVDDSITVRELLSMSFNKVGYRVEQARDGQEAWEKLRSGLPCDLVFCDIEMPRMDGLELLSRLQKDGGLQQIPIAMLTSRGADRHRQMAIDLGASGYFTKPYLEEALLDAANKMLHGEKLV